MKTTKYNGNETASDREKIATAVTKTNLATGQLPELSGGQVTQLVFGMEQIAARMDHTLFVEEIQELMEIETMHLGAFETAKRYVRYRYTRSLIRVASTTDSQILALIECNNEEAEQENASKNPVVNLVQRGYMAGEMSKDTAQRLLFPPDIVEAHKAGIIRFHDMDCYIQYMRNCDLVSLEDMLQNGTVILGTPIERPHSLPTACNIATQIITQVASNQYGGQSIPMVHLAPFVQVSWERVRRQILAEIATAGGTLSGEILSGIVEKCLREKVRRRVQTIQYQVAALITANGQAPFVTVFMCLGEMGDPQTRRDLALIIKETLVQYYEGVKNEGGVWITPASPKLIYVLKEDNVRPGIPYYYLIRLAAECTARRPAPDYISEKIMKQNEVDQNGRDWCCTCMGCHSFLTPYADPETGKPKYYDRFNQGAAITNLVDAALFSGGDCKRFWRVFDERLEPYYRALMCCHERSKGTLSGAAPILWQYDALTRLEKREPIDRPLYNGYSTISLGYAGLYECIKCMTGRSHTDPEAAPFALGVMEHMNRVTAVREAKEHINFSLYDMLLESTTYRFAKCLRKCSGVIPGITDKSYITNSYHVHVIEKIDAFSRLSLEARFQALSPGGAISYVEVPNMQQNLEAVLQVMGFIYDHIIYAELDTKGDYCQVCGLDGEIRVVEDDGRLMWECPKRGNREQSKLNVVRCTYGYIGVQFQNQGRTQEIKERVFHL